MQSPSQSNSQSNPVTTATTEKELDPEPAQKELDAQEGESKTDSAAETEAAVTPQGNGTLAETAAGMVGTDQPLTQPSDQTDTMELGSDLKPSAAVNPVDESPNGRVGQKVKNQPKVVRDGRRYVPSKKAMVDPLKMDMSKPAGIPLTSSQLSLQCIECHIIFSDHKSKERHLKASHPAEYEQCILRNALFACYVCDRHFTNSTELMAHQKAHIEKKPFKCPICGQAFSKSSELTCHKKNHFGSDGYACTDCGKLCKTMTLLKYHRRTHTGEKPYVCKECGQRFTMPKTLQKHVMSHLEGAEENGENSKAKLKNTDGVVKKYTCFLCNASFKTTKTRLHHMKNKHNMVPARNSKAIHTGQQFKQSTPIITPISISEPALLQVEPNGPLQKVDANIDTEQICRLIESLGNVQKVNQVVILGQVPPHAPPLEVQQISQLAEPIRLNPSQNDFMGLKLTESKAGELDLSNSTCDPMEQTIILEPITPDGQLINPPLSETGSSMLAAGTVGLNNPEPSINSCNPMEQTIILEPITPDGQLENCFPGDAPGELRFSESGQTEKETIPPLLQQAGSGAVPSDLFPDNLEQTVILELTPAVMPNEESHTEPQHDVPLSVLVPSTELEKITAEQTRLSGPPLPHTLELEEHHICSSPQIPREHCKDPKEGNESQLQQINVDIIPPPLDGAKSQETQEKNDQDASGKECPEQVEDLSKLEEPSAREKGVSQVETKQASQVALNTMSAQELVKVRKRKPSRAFFFQDYMQDLVGSIYKDDLQIKAKPAKRQRTEKAHLVVKFGPQSKEKKKKEKKTSQRRKQSQEDVVEGKTQVTNLPDKKGASQKKGRKGKGKKNARHLASSPKKKSSTPSHDSPVRQIKDARKNKMKKQKEVTAEGVTQAGKHASVDTPAFKKTKRAKIMRKVQPKVAKEGKRKKKRAEETEKSPASADVAQDALLLLKGHKQPQLRVYKLDTSKASGHARVASTQQSQTPPQRSTDHVLDPPTDMKHDLSAEGKKRGGRRKKTQKALSLLSSLKIPCQQPETLPSKPKTTRKRRASPKVETEGVITSSKRALECQDCGERFGEVSSLQKHKATVHVLDSPGLTYTNGNIFEGVTSLDFYHLPKRGRMVIGAMNAASGWDTEPELGETPTEDREPGVSFPALIPSPSLPVNPSDVVKMNESKGTSKSGATAPSASDQHRETHQSSGTEEPSMAAGRERDAAEDVHSAADEDVKEDLLMEVDLVTVGGQSEKDDPPCPVVPVGQTGPNQTCEGRSKSAAVVRDESEKSVSLQTCAALHMEVKEEEEEGISVQKKKGARDRELDRGAMKRGATGHQSAAAPTTGGAVGATRSEEEEQECQVVYEQHTISSDSEMNDGNEAGVKNSELESIAEIQADECVASSPPASSTLEESPEEPAALGPKPRNAGVEEEALNGRGEESSRRQSPAIILEKFPTPGQAPAAEDRSLTTATNKHRQIGGATEKETHIGSCEIKVEESVSEPQPAAASARNRQAGDQPPPPPPHQRDIRTVLVKEERTLALHQVQAGPGSRRMRWNVEPVHVENTCSPLVENIDLGRDCGLSPDINSSTCIFYPVKEEEREVPLAASQTGSSTETSRSSLLQTEHHAANSNCADESSRFAEDYQRKSRGLLPEPGPADISERQAAAETQWQQPPDYQDFLFQSLDEEDAGCLELSDPQLDTEAEVMSYFSRSQAEPATSPTTSQLQTPSAENTTRKPIEYFNDYFGQETWEEIAGCTIKMSNMSQPVTAREVAQFVGIHIAMGTLKFPSPKLYWEELTKVPLVADAMPLLRFLELSRTLKLAYPPEEVHCDTRRENDSQNVQHKTLLSSKKAPSHQKNGQFQRDSGNSRSCSENQTDPLWRVQALLRRFEAGCRSLRRDGDYAVDQYPLPLTGKMHKKPSLCCTTLVGFGGFLLHLDVKLGPSSKEDAVEKMVPRGSTVFLCRQELSTPAMLERLLLAGVHGAGRVGGAEGQIGDEFVSSDGKLMLRRSDWGFILSTVGNSQRTVASLTDDFEKAQMSAHLNRDLQSLYPTPLTISAPACWPQAVLWYLTDLALINSWLLHREEHAAPLSLMAFRLEVSKALVLSSSSDAQDSVPSQPPRERTRAARGTPNPNLVEESPLPDVSTRYDGLEHWPEQLGEGEGGRCRFRDCQRMSRVLCLKCCVFLCISRSNNCFLKFHNQESLGKG